MEKPKQPWTNNPKAYCTTCATLAPETPLKGMREVNKFRTFVCLFVVSIRATLECNSLAFAWLGLHSGPGQPVKHSLAAAKVTSQQARVIGTLHEDEAHIRGGKTVTKFETMLHQAIDKSVYYHIEDTHGQWVTLKHSNLHGKEAVDHEGVRTDGVRLVYRLQTRSTRLELIR